MSRYPKSVTVKELRESLAEFGEAYDNCEVDVWLPGSYIQLECVLRPSGDKVLIEGNLRPGSALGDD
jgi:hypothetical protein